MVKPAILTLNAGSSSLKFAVFGAATSGKRLMFGAVERIGLDGASFVMSDARGTEIVSATGGIGTHAEALERLLLSLDRLRDKVQLTAVGHRVAHGGPECDCPKRATPAILARLRRLIHLAPLHLPANIAGIEAVSASRPDLPQVACFDTSFHHDLPQIARMTGLPRRFHNEGLRRYGFHGLSYEYILEALRCDGIDVGMERIVVAHLGNGASLCAIRNAQSVETTMGFSTASGLPMGTRSGDLDPGLLLYLMTVKGISGSELSEMVFAGSGLLGLSGISRNMEDLLARHEEAAAEAIEYFCYHTRRHLAGLTASMGGIDRLVFTGGIGANAPRIRAAICDGLNYLGIALDQGANHRGGKVISAPGAQVKVEVRKTDEEAMIARHVRALAPCGATSNRAEAL